VSELAFQQELHYSVEKKMKHKEQSYFDICCMQLVENTNSFEMGLI
jgi:hypothetical protein